METSQKNNKATKAWSLVTFLVVLEVLSGLLKRLSD